MPVTKSIEFQTRDGLTLRGKLTLMDKPNAPLLIMLSPFGVTSDHLMNTQSKSFNDGGFATLTYDPRTFGKSDGLPRQHINFEKQSEDVFDAVTYATSLTPEVDANRIALLGGGHGGGVAIRETAVDPRVKALILQVPGISGAMDAQFYPPGLLKRSRAAVTEFSEKSTEKQEYIQIFPATAEEATVDPPNALFPGPALFGFYTFIQTITDGKDVDWENKVTLESAYYNFINEFQAYLPRVAPTPLLYIAPSGDLPAEPHEEAYAAANEPKEFYKIEPFDFGGYMYGGAKKTQMDVEVKFLQKHLM
ncbi:Alpha/Beta hydrolase protein [Trichoderma sp. SZMC 28014]